MINEATLSDYFSGKLEPQASGEVERWIEQSDENRQMAEELFYLHYSIQTLDTMNSVNTAGAWAALKSQIRRGRRNNIFIRLQRVVAILFIPVVCALSYLTYDKLSHSEDVQYVEMRANSGMITTVTLPDGSKVWLNSNSKIKYPIRFGKERRVELEGEAFFDVTKDPKYKFSVATNKGFHIEVLGTRFNVDAYDGKDITTTLIEGKVEVQYQGCSNIERVTMAPSQKFVYEIDSHTHTLTNSHSVLPDIAWKDGVIIFEDTVLADALNILSKRFDVSFVVDNASLYENRFTGKFTDQSLDVILKHFFVSSKIHNERKIVDNKKVIRLYQ